MRGRREEEERVQQRGLQNVARRLYRQYPVSSVHRLHFRNRIPVLVTLYRRITPLNRDEGVFGAYVTVPPRHSKLSLTSSNGGGRPVVMLNRFKLKNE